MIYQYCTFAQEHLTCTEINELLAAIFYFHYTSFSWTKYTSITSRTPKFAPTWRRVISGQFTAMQLKKNNSNVHHQLIRMLLAYIFVLKFITVFECELSISVLLPLLPLLTPLSISEQDFPLFPRIMCSYNLIQVFE